MEEEPTGLIQSLFSFISHSRALAKTCTVGTPHVPEHTEGIDGGKTGQIADAQGLMGLQIDPLYFLVILVLLSWTALFVLAGCLLDAA